MNTRHVFITGGSGFIGTRVCKRLLKQGFDLTVLTRDVSRARTRLPEGVRLIDNIRQLDKLEPVEAVVNLAGEPLADRRWNEARKRLFFSSRVDLTNALYEHFSRNRVTDPAVLVSGSAVGYYGPRGDEVISESSTAGNCFSSQLCQAWETAARQFENLGTRVCRIRTGIVLGAGGGALGAMLMPFRLGLGGPIGHGRQWMSWVHREDMAKIIDTALKTPSLEGAINATAPAPVRNRQFAKTLGSVLSRPAFLPFPGVVARALFGQMADELLLSGQQVMPKKLLGHGFVFDYPELEPALRGILNRH